MHPWGTVKYIPELRANLISVGQLDKDGHVVKFGDGICTMQTKEGKVLAQAIRQNSLVYVVQHGCSDSECSDETTDDDRTTGDETDVATDTSPNDCTTDDNDADGATSDDTSGDTSDNTSDDETSPEGISMALCDDTDITTGTALVAATRGGTSDILLDWHRRLGHMCVAGIKQLQKRGLIDINDKEFKKGMSKCIACIMGKMARKPFPTEAERRATRKAELVHMDICGPMRVPSDGKRFFIIFVDDATRITRLYLIERKSEALQRLKDYISDVLRPEGLHLRALRSDNAEEFMSNEFTAFCKQEGIAREFTARNAAQQNGVAERANRTIVEMARAMLYQARLGESWWGHAVQYAAYIKNRCPTAALDQEIPFERWTGRRAAYQHIRPFGCTAYVFVPDQLRTNST
jgi:hypothetical protein